MPGLTISLALLLVKMVAFVIPRRLEAGSLTVDHRDPLRNTILADHGHIIRPTEATATVTIAERDLTIAPFIDRGSATCSR